jgi:serine/threonine-protein kinase
MPGTAPISPQSSIAHYKILAKLGEGGMGEVWPATDTKLGREVAIKICPKRWRRMPTAWRASSAKRKCWRPSIIRISQLSTASKNVRSFWNWSIAAGPIPFEEALPIAKQIAEAQEYAHERGVIHRDLKPANIKITPDGAAKVLDFGLASVRRGGECDPAEG